MTRAEWREGALAPLKDVRHVVADEPTSGSTPDALPTISLATDAKMTCEPTEPQRVDTASSFDRLIHAAMGRATLAISPASLALAYFDWAFHLAITPGKWQTLVEKGLRKGSRFAVHASRALANPTSPPCIEPLPQDHRFDHPEWRLPPFRFIYQWFLLNQQWWHNATADVHDVSHHHEQVVSFAARQLLDTVSPSNFIATNPELLRRTLEAGATNLLQGMVNWVEDWERAIAGRAPVGSEKFRPGKEVAVTAGEVVYRNRRLGTKVASWHIASLVAVYQPALTRPEANRASSSAFH